MHADLFGDLVLHKQWGGKGTRLGGTRVVAVGQESIARAFGVIEKERLRAGYSRVNNPSRLTVQDFRSIDASPISCAHHQNAHVDHRMPCIPVTAWVVLYPQC